ncbi:hypothetical protein LINPERPRIM_LOCUS3301 [Linum perenne]
MEEEEGKDRISALPEAIVHVIIDRLPSPKKAAKLIFVSKRWYQLWLSDPIVKFDEYEFRSRTEFTDRNPFFNDVVYAPIEPLKGFAAAVLRKLSHQSATAAATSAVRVIVSPDRWGPEFCSSFLDHLLDLLAAQKVSSSKPMSLQEIDFRFGYDSYLNLIELEPIDYHAYNVPTRLLQFNNLKVLKLAFCDFRLYSGAVIMSDDMINPFAAFGSCLELLELDHVSFPSARILNSIIASASRLKTLILNSIFGTGGFQVHSHPNIQVLKTDRLIGGVVVEIISAHSLEILRLTNWERDNWEKGGLRVSSTPNLKVLDIQNSNVHGCQVITGNEISKLILQFPSLESVTLKCVPPIEEFEIHNSDKLREVRLYMDEFNDAHRSIKFVYDVVDHLFPCNRSVDPAPFYCKVRCRVNFQQMKQFLHKCCQFRVFLEFKDYELLREPVKDALPIPIIESVRLTSNIESTEQDDSFLDMLLESCHPKFLSVNGKGHFQNVCKRFMERSFNDDCRRACECWRHQLKDAKIINKVLNGEIKEDEEMEISEEVVSYLVDKKQITFILSWY